MSVNGIPGHTPVNVFEAPPSPPEGIPYRLMEGTSPVWFLLALCCCVVIESFTPLDAVVQSLFYDGKGWLVSKDLHHEYRSLLYSGPKKVVMYGWLSCAVLFAGALLLSRRNQAAGAWIRPALLGMLCIGLVPLCVNLFKYLTGVHCPDDLAMYGGKECYEGFLKPLLCERRLNDGRCFPAAHCSGGFAFMSLYFLPLRQRWRNALFYAGALWGAFMAIYQTLRGQHFLSHTLATVCFTLLFITIAARLLGLARRRRRSPGGFAGKPCRRMVAGRPCPAPGNHEAGNCSRAAEHPLPSVT